MEKYIEVEVKTEKVTDPIRGSGTIFIYPNWKGIDHRVIGYINKDLTKQLFVIEGKEKELTDFIKQKGIREITKEEYDSGIKK